MTDTRDYEDYLAEMREAADKVAGFIRAMTVAFCGRSSSIAGGQRP